jgi:glycerol-3-phosphate O-acyltransferase/dihydroxyacetone phosphate acyltransferase
VNVPIVPVGLNYFRGHRFRGRVVVEFGPPIHIDKALFQTYKESKRDAFQRLLTTVREGMQSALVTATDYNELKLIHTTRRLYQRASSGITTAQKQDLARRFSVAARLLREKYGGELPEDMRMLQRKLEDYQDKLSRWGLKDYQITNLEQEVSFSKVLYTFFHGAIVMSLASIPSLILNAPVGVAASYWASKEAKKDLKVLTDCNSLCSIAIKLILLLFYCCVLFYYFSPLRLHPACMIHSLVSLVHCHTAVLPYCRTAVLP